MKKLAFLALVLIAFLAACQKQGSDAAVPKSDSVASAPASDSSLVLHPTVDQIAKAKRVGNKHCPVSGEKLGGMGTPISVIYKGELVELCCAGCVKDFEKDPAGMLAKAKADTVLD